MSGNREGGKKAAIVNKERHGADYYKRIGALGGSKSHPETRPFTKNPELARRAGEKGGRMSKRGASKEPREHKPVEIKPTTEAEKKGIFKWFSGRKDK